MTETREQTGPFLRRIYFEASEIEALCSEALMRARLLPATPRPVRIDRFVEKFFRAEVRAVAMDSGSMGAIRFNGAGQVLAVYVSEEVENDTTDHGRRRFRSTVAHEAGHGLLHGRLFAEKLLNDEAQPDLGIVRSGDDVHYEGFVSQGEIVDNPGRRYSWWEFQANMAMSCLLLPWKLITAAAEPFRDMYAGVAPTARDAVVELAANRLAETFDVNPVMVRFRLKNWWKEALQLSLL